MPETENPIDPLAAYLQEYGGRYKLEALRQHLLQQGYEPERVDAAIDAFRLESGARESPGFLATLAMVLAVIVGVGILIFGTCIGLLGFLTDAGNGHSDQLLLVYLGVALTIALGVTLIVFPIRWYRRRSRRPPSLGQGPPSPAPGG